MSLLTTTQQQEHAPAPRTVSTNAADPAPARHTGTIVQTATAGALALIALLVAGTSAAWVAGSLGISAAAASQIVTAIEVGGAALTIVGAVFGAGIGGAVAATIRGIVMSQGRKAAAA